MHTGATSENFRINICHADRIRRFLIYDALPDEPITEVGHLDLPQEMSLHKFHVTERCYR